MTGNHAYHGGVANSRRTRLTAGWTPMHHTEPRKYEITDGPVANALRSRAEEDGGHGES
ncbi:hypothetical protein [Micromonospora deserti]|uniref:hypothetical protein n=1 Tax=Micromonospora deserti TaxID=2070366 RepID=UPI0018F6E781|nr:hypothetical protein [Micromonospora deserti]